MAAATKSEGNFSLHNIRLTAAADISAKTFVNGDGTVGTLGSAAVGVALWAFKNTTEGEVQTMGIANVIAGDAVPIGTLVMSDASGHAIPATAAAIASGATPVTSTGANGAIISGGALPCTVLGKALSVGVNGAEMQVQLR